MSGRKIRIRRIPQMLFSVAFAVALFGPLAVWKIIRGDRRERERAYNKPVWAKPCACGHIKFMHDKGWEKCLKKGCDCPAYR